MSNSYVTLVDPSSQDVEEVPKYASGKGKFLAVVSLLGGVGLSIFLSGGISPLSVAQNPNTFMTLPSIATQTRFSIASLPGPTALKNRFIQEMEATSGKCRDVSMKAQASPKEWIDAWEARSGGGALTTSNFDDVDLKLMAYPGKTKPLTKDQVKEMAGVTAPLGIFDPFGISTKVPEGQLLFYREAELKHGRVCMMAILGLVVGERHDFIPLLGSGVDPTLPAYVWSGPFVQETEVAKFWPFAIGALFFEEARREYTRKQNPDRLPGDYGWDPLGLKPKNPKELKELQNKELNNGRLAMFASAGIIAGEMVTGKNVLPPPLSR